MALFSDLVTDVIHYVPKCPEYLVEKELRRAAVDFFEETQVFTHTSETDTVAGTPEITPDLPIDTSMVQIKSVKADGKELTPITENMANKMPDSPNGKPLHYYERWNEIVLVPAPTSAVTVSVHMAVKPTRDASELDDIQLERWYNGISAGAIARLTTMPERAWTSPALAGQFNMQWEIQKKRAKGKAAGRNNVTRTSKFSW